jgi:hypothetical protein
MTHTTSVHVVSDRYGSWTVRRENDRRPLSHHGSETEAERAAARHARELGAREVLVHDRYERVHRART